MRLSSFYMLSLTKNMDCGLLLPLLYLTQPLIMVAACDTTCSYYLTNYNTSTTACTCITPGGTTESVKCTEYCSQDPKVQSSTRIIYDYLSLSATNTPLLGVLVNRHSLGLKVCQPGFGQLEIIHSVFCSVCSGLLHLLYYEQCVAVVAESITETSSCCLVNQSAVPVTRGVVSVIYYRPGVAFHCRTGWREPGCNACAFGYRELDACASCLSYATWESDALRLILTFSGDNCTQITGKSFVYH